MADANAGFKPAQSYDNELNAVKGWPSPYALDKTVAVRQSGATITSGGISPVKAGMVGFKKSAAPDLGQFEFAIPTVTTNFAPMPLFVFNNGDDYDAVGDHGNITGAVSGGTRAPSVLTLPACGAFELQTTQYTGSSFKPGDLLMAAAAADGTVELATAGSGSLGEIICGCVSEGLVEQDHTSMVLAADATKFLQFWSIYKPQILPVV